MSFLTLLLAVLAVLWLAAGLPTWPYSANWGFYPTGGIWLLLLVLLFLALTGKLGLTPCY